MSESTKSGGDVVMVVDLRADLEQASNCSTKLQLVRIDANETAVIPFTSEAVEVQIHYVDDVDVRGYVRCNGADCILCRIGRKKEIRKLLPVYVPTERRIAVLAISDAASPGTLKPQLLPLLKKDKPVVICISKPDRITYAVNHNELSQGMDDGVAAIKAFQDEDKEEKQREIAEVYQKLDNSVLAELQSVSAMMSVKGIRLHDGD